jgi:membrane-bound lytic murein transglycosylase A
MQAVSAQRTWIVRTFASIALAALAACTTAPTKHGPPIEQENSRWVPVHWSELPDWDQDSVRLAWPALESSCERPAQAWTRLCASLAQEPPRSDAQARDWLTTHLQPYRVESRDGKSSGLATGYYEPMIEARRKPSAGFRAPLYAPPADLATRRPYWTRQQLESLPAAQSALRGREIAYVADPLDALVLQIQGSGRLRITEPEGSVRTVRLAFAGHNDQPYKSVGRWLIEQGELPAGQASWPQIKAWAQRNPARVEELLWANPRYVFFREEPLADPALGPRGAMGVPLTPGRSIAVDPRSIPYGTPVWIDTTEPLGKAPLRRLVLAQDTGSAIVGAVRADYFWGWGDDAAEQAGRMKQPLRMWVLWPSEKQARPASRRGR